MNNEDDMKNRDYIALEFAKALIPVYWDTVSEYESAQELVKCLMETAYEHADVFITQMTSD